jgi:hypothetical protein
VAFHLVGAEQRRAQRRFGGGAQIRQVLKLQKQRLSTLTLPA